jgi:pimeloyl-ACP methyl ester carboxylesterase
MTAAIGAGSRLGMSAECADHKSRDRRDSIRTTMKAARLASLITAATLGLAGCGTGSSPSALTSPSIAVAGATPSTTPDPLATPSLSGVFPVDASGRELAMTCWGVGEPAVFLESGGPPIDEFSGHPLVRRLASETQICLYNHAGESPSDPAPNRPREAEDVAADFRALVRAAGIAPPYVLFGRSFGGMVVTFYASKYPKDVAGVIVFDSPAPSATMTRAQFPEGVWDYPGNVEHLNVLTGYENRFGKYPVHIDAPLILISPTAGESTPEDRYWLQTSEESRQVILEGGTEVIDTEADAIAEQILSLVQAAASPSPSG